MKNYKQIWNLYKSTIAKSLIQTKVGSEDKIPVKATTDYNVLKEGFSEVVAGLKEVCFLDRLVISLPDPEIILKYDVEKINELYSTLTDYFIFKSSKVKITSEPSFKSNNDQNVRSSLIQKCKSNYL